MAEIIVEHAVGSGDAEMLHEEQMIPDHIQVDVLSEDDYIAVSNALELRSVEELAKGVMTVDRIIPVLKAMITKVYRPSV